MSSVQPKEGGWAAVNLFTDKEAEFRDDEGGTRKTDRTQASGRAPSILCSISEWVSIHLLLASNLSRDAKHLEVACH